jgi:hypothetical protein
MLFSQFVRKSADIVTTRYLITLLDVVEGEQSVVAVAHVIHAEMYAGTAVVLFLNLPEKVILKLALNSGRNFKYLYIRERSFFEILFVNKASIDQA